jgi:hypothetical protein
VMWESQAPLLRREMGGHVKEGPVRLEGEDRLTFE